MPTWQIVDPMQAHARDNRIQAILAKGQRFFIAQLERRRHYVGRQTRVDGRVGVRVKPPRRARTMDTRHGDATDGLDAAYLGSVSAWQGGEGPPSCPS